jgi:hypothetical protein
MAKLTAARPGSECMLSGQPLPENTLGQAASRHPPNQDLGIAPMEGQQVGQPIVGWLYQRKIKNTQVVLAIGKRPEVAPKDQS